ncbi:MAG: hypothetical protein WBA10_09075 [Elainellaceae cyanobacterium]
MLVFILYIHFSPHNRSALLALGGCATEPPSPRSPEVTEATPSEPAQDDSTLTITAQDIGPVMARMTLEEAGQS